ncbi:MAG: hypothetical protein ACOCP8_07140 [archaeon]
MKKKQKKELIKIIESVKFGKIIINKQNNKIVNIKKVKSIKLEE